MIIDSQENISLRIKLLQSLIQAAVGVNKHLKYAKLHTLAIMQCQAKLVGFFQVNTFMVFVILESNPVKIASVQFWCRPLLG